MKYIKSFALVALAMVTTMASANVTSTAKIRIQANASLVGANVVVVEDDAVANDYTSSNNALYLSGVQNNYTVDFYAVGGSHNYAAIEISSIGGQQFVFKANKVETAYTMSFSDLAGIAFQLRRESNSELIDITAGDYDFTCAVNAEETFTVVMPYVAPTYERALKAGQQFGTICYPYAITAVDGAALYEVAGMEDCTLYLDEVSTFVAGKPYIFKADAAEMAAGKVVFTYDDAAAVAAPVAATGLVGTFSATTIAADGKYVITGNAVKPASAASTVGEYRAYIDLDGVGAPGATAPGVRRIGFRISNVTTDVENLEAAQAEGKFLRDGQLVIIREGVRYNAQGNVIK